MKLRETRLLLGKQQKEVADDLNISRSTYSQYETEKRAPDFNTLCKLANYFNVTTDYLLGRTEDPTPPDLQKERPSDEERLNDELDNIYNYIKAQPPEEQERLTAILRDVLAAVRQGRGE